MNQSEIGVKSCDWRQGRENACGHVTISLGFHWLKNWRGFRQPVIRCDGKKPKQTQNLFRHSIENPL